MVSLNLRTYKLLLKEWWYPGKIQAAVFYCAGMASAGKTVWDSESCRFYRTVSSGEVF